jgi:hypothetical protein
VDVHGTFEYLARPSFKCFLYKDLKKNWPKKGSGTWMDPRSRLEQFWTRPRYRPPTASSFEQVSSFVERDLQISVSPVSVSCLGSLLPACLFVLQVLLLLPPLLLAVFVLLLLHLLRHLLLLLLLLPCYPLSPQFFGLVLIATYEKFFKFL